MRRRLTGLSLALLLLCAACVPGTLKDGPAEGEAAVWFLAQENGEQGSALAREYRSLPNGEAGVETLLSLLLSGPESQELTSPFPRGTVVRSWRLEGNLVLVDLSESYGGLSGADLSLADGCMVLTLCQLPEVERIYLTVEGRPRPFRDQMLGPDDFLLENGAGGESTAEVRLWFPSGEGIAAEERTLPLSVGDDPKIAVVQALLAGPESGELWPVCPADTTLRSLRIEGERCIVDVSGGWLAEGEEDPRRLQAVTATLAEWVPNVQVEVWVEGQAVGDR